MDARSFLAEHPPFDELNDKDLERVVAAVEIEHFAPGAVILQQAGAPATHLFVVRRGEVDILDGGRVIDEIGEGDVFGMWSLLGKVAPSATVRASEDTLCYLIPAGVANDVLRTGAGVAFVAASVRRRIARVDETLRAEIDPARYRTVGELIRRPPVTAGRSTTVADAAGIMARERVSSLLVPGTDGGVGILTDRDLRTRVVAERRSSLTPIEDVLTPQAETVPAETMAGEVLLRMLEGGFHHFPVVDAAGTVVGVVTDTDLMGIGRNTPFALKSAIARAPDRDGVARAVAGLPEVIASLVESSADPVDVGHVTAFSIDAATRRLLELAIAELGTPPVEWAWLALGSAARQEQAIHTDQDHALAFEGDREVQNLPIPKHLHDTRAMPAFGPDGTLVIVAPRRGAGLRGAPGGSGGEGVLHLVPVGERRAIHRRRAEDGLEGEMTKGRARSADPARPFLRLDEGFPWNAKEIRPRPAPPIAGAEVTFNSV